MKDFQRLPHVTRSLETETRLTLVAVEASHGHKSVIEHRLAIDTDEWPDEAVPGVGAS